MHWLDRPRNLVVVPLILAALTLVFDYGKLQQHVAQLEQQHCRGDK